jgi:NADH dehydrogenase
MGAEARTVIEKATAELGIECRTGIEVAALDGDGVTLAGGERIEAGTVVWTAGMRANPMTGKLPGTRDRLGRVEVNEFMRLDGVDGVFVAGDMARAKVDGQHTSVMSCQHGRPMGRFAGHNVACAVLGQEPLALDIDYYVTCLDLGPWGAVLTRGWERKVVAEGADAKEIKRTINCQRIYPPRSRNRREILDAGAPVIQAPPQPTG